jgi:bla regulator protein blaR1
MMRWAVDMLVSTGVLLALVMILRRPVARYFGAGAGYALWLAPVVRLIVPIFAVSVAPPAILIETGAAASAALAPVNQAVPVGSLLTAAWLGGAILFLLYHALTYRRFLRVGLERATAVTEPGIDDAAILACDAVTGPAASGLFVRRIFVPRDFTSSFSAEERRLALWHEVLHHRRGDLWASAAALLILALHWFNPIAHAAHRAFRRDVEAACDADLLARAGRGTRQAYARTILRCVARPVPLPICALTHTDELKGRIAMMNHDHGTIRRLTGKGVAATLAAAGLMLAVPVTAAPQDGASKMTEIRKIVRIGGPAGQQSQSIDLKDCAGEKFEAGSSPAPGKQQHTKILLCGKLGASKAQTADTLEKALARIQGETELTAESKAQIVSALQKRIADLRAGN